MIPTFCMLSCHIFNLDVCLYIYIYLYIVNILKQQLCFAYVTCRLRETIFHFVFLEFKVSSATIIIII